MLISLERCKMVVVLSGQERAWASKRHRIYGSGTEGSLIC